MTFALIICTYMRPVPLCRLLESVARQEVYPNQILVIDGSRDDLTRQALEETSFPNLEYFVVTEKDRGLTRQRNFGIARVRPEIDVVFFLDDDTILEPDYFAQVLKTYDTHPEALGVGGYITNEVEWQPAAPAGRASFDTFVFDGWKRDEPSRFRIRRRLGLDSNVPPGHSPLFSHGRSIGFLPPTGKTYPVQQLMGGVSSFRKRVFDTFSFSHYFDGYGLYEDADFTLRLSKTGPLYINTNARLAHYHDAAGRPNRYSYGKMVVRNGWYVWRVRNPKPAPADKLKWHAITLLLTGIRFANIFTTGQRRQALTETLGRLAGWVSLVYDKPRP